jgi:hypothetical protein
MTDRDPGPTCPMCHEARLGPTLPDWYVVYMADSAPGDRVQRGMPVGMRTCPNCDHVAFFLPPTLDSSGRPQRSRQARAQAARTWSRPS